jgi:hypothetical protein
MDRERAIEIALNWFRRETHVAGPVIPRAEPSVIVADAWLVTLKSPELHSTIVVTVTAVGVTLHESIPAPSQERTNEDK